MFAHGGFTVPSTWPANFFLHVRMDPIETLHALRNKPIVLQSIFQRFSLISSMYIGVGFWRVYSMRRGCISLICGEMWQFSLWEWIAVEIWWEKAVFFSVGMRVFCHWRGGCVLWTWSFLGEMGRIFCEEAGRACIPWVGQFSLWGVGCSIPCHTSWKLYLMGEGSFPYEGSMQWNLMVQISLRGQFHGWKWHCVLWGLYSSGGRISWRQNFAVA